MRASLLTLTRRSLTTSTRAIDLPHVLAQQHISAGATEAFHVIDLGAARNQFAQWNDELPRVKPFYAVKCNPDEELVRTLHELGAGFDCASRGELSQILDSGVAADDIIFANPCKQESHVAFARGRGVALQTFDNHHELHKMAALFPGARLVLRIAVDDSHALCQLSNKFGAQLEEVPALAATARALGLDICGVSFHVGSGVASAEEGEGKDSKAPFSPASPPPGSAAASFADAVTAARTAFDLLTTAGFSPTLLDIGGGFPGFDDEPEQTGAAAADAAAAAAAVSPDSFPAIAAAVRGRLDALFPASSGVDIISEPGRFFAARTHTLAVSVFAKRSVLATPEAAAAAAAAGSVGGAADPSFMYYCNDGVYGSFNCTLFDHATVAPAAVLRGPRPTTATAAQQQQQQGEEGEVHWVSARDQLLLGGGQSQQRTHAASLWGPTCDGLDKIVDHCLLPELVPSRDWLTFRNMGAYTTSAASAFNGFSVPAVVYMDSSSATPFRTAASQRQQQRHAAAAAAAPVAL